ncbi:MAG TPA: glycosyltransferase [Chitinophagales bacterium]|jgi:glycosyltransferase involved in cell wall biosynthesis|nr:glycosyltransferase [Chitinophagales bacterium]HQV78646.1 glycosyltransferase [Chitinophagales bacterium]HQW78968.1 glycosyltransferase [Chitinophagales bacterium]HRB68286.1 glycosyltransferase [Chitinophagales bacterium]
MPQINVLMTAYNAEKYIAKAIDSILIQSFSDFQFIILDDGSTDNTLSIIKSYSDSRIKILQPGKIGYYAAKIMLIESASSEFIAIMDADDIAEKNRLQLQYDFLVNNPDYSLVGSRASWIDSDGNLLNKEFPFIQMHEEIKCHLLFTNCLVHTSILIRRKTLAEYHLNYKKIAGEDFDFWIRIIQHSKAINLNAVLINYRIHNNNMHYSNWYKLGEGISYLITDELKNYFKSNVDENDIQTHLSLVEFSLKNEIQDLEAIKNWITKLLNLNQQYQHFDEAILKQVLYERILKKLLRLKNYNFTVYQTLSQLKKQLQPQLNLTLRKKEMAIFVFSLFRKQIVSL